jgi:hypothetical protein
VLHQLSQRAATELAVRRQVVAPLGVLEQRDEHESENRNDGVENQLPRVDARDDEDGGQPENDQQDGDAEESSGAHELRRRFGEAVKDTSRLVGRRCLSHPASSHMFHGCRQRVEPRP